MMPSMSLPIVHLSDVTEGLTDLAGRLPIVGVARPTPGASLFQSRHFWQPWLFGITAGSLIYGGTCIREYRRTRHVDLLTSDRGGITTTTIRDGYVIPMGFAASSSSFSGSGRRLSDPVATSPSPPRAASAVHPLTRFNPLTPLRRQLLKWDTSMCRRSDVYRVYVHNWYTGLVPVQHTLLRFLAVQGLVYVAWQLGPVQRHCAKFLLLAPPPAPAFLQRRGPGVGRFAALLVSPWVHLRLDHLLTSAMSLYAFGQLLHPLLPSHRHFVPYAVLAGLTINCVRYTTQLLLRAALPAARVRQLGHALLEPTSGATAPVMHLMAVVHVWFPDTLIAVPGLPFLSLPVTWMMPALAAWELASVLGSWGGRHDALGVFEAVFVGTASAYWVLGPDGAWERGRRALVRLHRRLFEQPRRQA